MNIDIIKDSIKAALPAAEIFVEGDNKHFQVYVVSDEFCGKNSVQRHQIIYRALGDKVGNEIHALSLKTHTKAQWEEHRKLKP